MMKAIMITALLMGCQGMIFETEPNCTIDGGTMKDQDGKIGPAANVWKIWDHDQGEWWGYYQMDDGAHWDIAVYQWDSYEEASEAFELAYEEDPTSIPELMNFVEFKMVRAQRRSPVGTEIVEYDEKK